MYKEAMYRIEVINLAGEIVYLSLDSKKQFCIDALPTNLPDDVYLVRISGEDEYSYEKLILHQEF